MEENTTQVSEVTTTSSNDEWVVDVSDLMETETETPTETEQTEVTEETASEVDEADQQTQTEDEADKETTEPNEAKQTDQFVLKHLGNEVTKSREEVVALAQMGLDYDRVRSKYDEITNQFGNIEQLSKNKERLDTIDQIVKNGGYKDLDEFIEATQIKTLVEEKGMTEAEARRQINFDKRERELKEKEAKLLAERTAKESEAEAAKKAEEKRQNDIKTFIEEYPGIKPTDIPKEVWDKVNSGDSLVSAYRAYENRELRKKLEAAAKNTENKVRSTGSRSTAGQTTTEKDKFLDGWNAAI